MFSAKILADSISPDNVRLTTMEVTFPRIVLSEFNTHRMFSRNSASSRAIPIDKMIAKIKGDPYIPTHWGKNQKGMAAYEELSLEEQESAKIECYKLLDSSIATAESLLKIGVHKQVTNRYLEPFMWQTVIVSATEFSNFFNLRDHETAHPEIRKIAQMMKDVYYKNIPKSLSYGQWHLPLILDEEMSLNINDLIKISVGRCARVSYLTHDGKRDIAADIELHDRLMQGGHMSPFEHVARPMTQDETGHWINCEFGNSPEITFCGNFRGWVQYRKTIQKEHDMLGK